MVGMTVMPDIFEEISEQVLHDKKWRLIVWNDPVNLMSYVSYVFRSHFGFSAEKAEKLMMQVHHDGFSVILNGSREKIEGHVQAMHGYGLNATMSQEA
ncbi:ATP-dependent Clp protease adapter ClpS [Glutamicibacter creatinolyticus]